MILNFLIHVFLALFTSFALDFAYKEDNEKVKKGIFVRSKENLIEEGT